MKAVLISDIHNRQNHLSSNENNNLPDADLLLIAGDLSGVGSESELSNFFKWLKKQSPRYKKGVVFIAGNHDRSFDTKFNDGVNKPEWLNELLYSIKTEYDNIHYLENQEIIIDGIKIYGSPISPWFHGDRWAFNAHRGDDIRKYWSMIPEDTDILMVHSPVAYKLDYIPSVSEYVGCEDLRKVVNKIKPKLFICGHIHESYGIEEDEHTIYINASVCDLSYVPSNKPWLVEITENKEIKIL